MTERHIGEKHVVFCIWIKPVAATDDGEMPGSFGSWSGRCQRLALDHNDPGLCQHSTVWAGLCAWDCLWAFRYGYWKHGCLWGSC